MNKKPCTRCLLKDLNEKDFEQHIAAYLKELGTEKKVPEEEYQKRLSQCLSCDSLIQGVCKDCGCFVELRAIHPKASCPHLPPKWESAPQGI